MGRSVQLMGEIEERPPGYRGPNLDPEGLVLQPVELSTNVYALMANVPPKDNNGVIIGSKGVVVVDAGINGRISRQIQETVRTLTDLPLRYLVNTTYHGDHTFGNYAFDNDVVIVSSLANRESMKDLAKEKRVRSNNLGGNLSALDDVTKWRLPDIVFDDYCEIDLGDRVVELWHFGPGNGPGDVVAYVPEAKAAWTGNFLPRAGIPTMLLEGGPRPYIESLERMRDSIDVATVVCGHGPMGDGSEAIETLIAYLRGLDDDVGRSVIEGVGLDRVLEATELPSGFGMPEGMPFATDLNDLVLNLHKLNVLATYRVAEANAK